MALKPDTWSWADVLPAGSFVNHKPSRKGPGRHRNPMRADAVRLVLAGKTYAEVARQLGLSRSQVAGFMYRENGN